MKKIFHTLFVLLLSGAALVSAQSPVDQRYNGWPTEQSAASLSEKFVTPPSGYGNVPFFWLNGDTLTHQRMSALLDELGSAAISGFSASYIHMNPQIDSVLHRKEFGLYGHTDPGKPEVFSPQWWQFWNWFSGDCARRGLGTGMDDYTVGWYGNGYYPDEVYKRSEIKNYQGKLLITAHTLQSGASLTLPLPEHLVSVTAFPLPTRQTEPLDLKSFCQGGKLQWKVPSGGSYTVYIVSTEADYLLHPDAGRELVKAYFGRFEQNLDAEGKRGLNYFFQDELSYPLTMLSWAEDLPQEFLRRKGYDVVPYLAALKYDIGEITAKIRIDYCDVVMSLAEERYFQPVFDWNNSRGLIYGCDNLGRGLQPLQYLDYFRATSWFTAPGNDAPARGSSFLQTKISSSIAHLYGRPRTWLEAFHSMGWGSQTEWLTEQIDHHFMAGGNLVCLHGLYYSTHGGWWEWAPPAFFQQMPYWPHMKKWLEYTQRMSYLLSQGSHSCDLAILYPTETLQVTAPEKQGATYDFSFAKTISDAGVDYDFIDSRSILNGTIRDKELWVGNEHYKILLLKDIQALPYNVLVKLLDFYRAGGALLAVGDLPSASNRTGSNDPEVDNIVKEIFGLTAAQTETIAIKAQKNNGGGTGFYINMADRIAAIVRRAVGTDFNPGRHGGEVLHRTIGDKELYMVMNTEPGSECFFRAKGKAELWNAFDGTISPLPVLKVTDEGTTIRLQTPKNRSSLIVFSPGEPVLDTSHAHKPSPCDTLKIEGDWQCRIVPTLDNRWGDFRLPASDQKIGAEVRHFRYLPAKWLGRAKNWMMPTYNDSSWDSTTYGYGIPMEVLIDSSRRSTAELSTAALNGTLKGWRPYPFSWQYGVEEQPGSQGYHGLKGRVEDNFLILDKGRNMLFRTEVFVPENGTYVLVTGNRSPDAIFLDGEPLSPLDSSRVTLPNGQQETRYTVTLHKGWCPLLVLFRETQDLPLQEPPYNTMDTRPRSAVVLLPVGDSAVRLSSPYDSLVAMKWFRTPHLLYSPSSGETPRTLYRFESAPGLSALRITVNGQLEKAWVDGIEYTLKKGIRTTGIGSYEISLPVHNKATGNVTLQVIPNPGVNAGALFPEPIQLICEEGVIRQGDWSKEGALRDYSGGMLYRKTLTFTAEEIARGVTLDLGHVSASCELKINDHAAGILLFSPFTADITPYLHPGENTIEVLVYSTLANHYQTSPSPYKGTPEAGLMGPVRLILGGR